MTDWNSTEEGFAAMKAGQLPPGYRMDGDTLVIPDDGRKFPYIAASFHEVRTQDGEVVKTRGLARQAN